MLSKSQRLRFNELRNRQAEGGNLSPTEISEITVLTNEIEAAEKAYLAPATARLRSENSATEERIQALNALVEQKERFATRLQAMLAEVQLERHTMAAER